MSDLLFSKSIKSRRQNKAFTLIELLVVISIIGMLSSVIMVSLQGARDKGRIGAGIKFATYNNRAFGADAIAYYNFNESGTTALDGSGNGITLTLYDGRSDTDIHESTEKVSANGGSYISLNGTSKYAVSGTLPSSIQGKAITKYTTSAWVYLNALPGGYVGVVEMYPAVIIPPATMGHAAGLLLRGSNLFGEHGTCSSIANPASGIKINTWQHVAATYNGTDFSLYIDGKFITKSNSAGCTSVTPNASTFVNVGRYSNSVYLNGRVDDVAIYTQSLTASDIQSIYAQGAAKHGIAVR